MLNKNSHRSIVTLVLAILLANAACYVPFINDPDPATSEPAQEGYELSEPIIAALEASNIDNGIYPDSLEDLIPDYLDTLPVGHKVKDFIYEKTDFGYLLKFTFYSGGACICSYDPKYEWDCRCAY